ncbi:polysaccharide deacetylase family protein [Pseudonocardia ailaonensis]|uniref:Polysaccharide deacetylase family protein n=1 Tax=Pseudonocardia ailaonensis TaxID=367279 RepID=A0ABN2NBX4_9PSEU
MAILCYHSVACGWDDPVSVEPEDFERQCRRLARSGRVVPLSAMLDRLESGREIPARRTVLTFDDGFADYAHFAVPIMRRYGLPAAMYLVAGSLTPEGVPVNWITGLPAEQAPPLLTVEEIKDLRAQGWEFGSHTMRHADLRTLGEEECYRDLKESREIISDLLSESCDVLAYPFGRHSEHVRRAARKAGYRIALALPEEPEERGPFAVSRTGIYRGNGGLTFEAKINPAYAAVRRLRQRLAA